MGEYTKRPTGIKVTKDQIAGALWEVNRCITNMKEQINKDYLHFFEWQAEEMFKAHKRRAFLVSLTEALDQKDKEIKLSAWFLDMAQRKINSLVHTGLRHNSTGPMANRAHILNLEVERELIIFIEGLACAAEFYGE